MNTPVVRQNGPPDCTRSPSDKAEAIPYGMSFGQWNELLEMIYHGAMETLPWSTALGKIGSYIKSYWTTIVLRTATTDGPGLIVNYGPQGPHVVEGQYASLAAFTLDPFIGLPKERILSVDEFLGTEQWLASEYYQQFSGPGNARHILGADLLTNSGTECRFRISRPKEAEAFNEEDKYFCQLLLPHLKRSADLRSNMDIMETERKLLAGTVDKMLLGIVILDERGMFLRMNKVAEDILGEQDGIALKHSLLEASYSSENQELQRLIRQALLHAHKAIKGLENAMSITRPSGKTKLGIAVGPVPTSDWSEGKHRPTLALFIRDSERKSQSSGDMLRQLFELTPAEAALSLLLTEGLSLDEASDELGIRKNTARAHLRSIFSKTGVTRQTSLIRLLLNSMTPLD